MNAPARPSIQPHNIEAEQALLGAILSNNDALHAVSSFLKASHFYDPVHARIFAAFVRFAEKGRLATVVTLKTYFDADDGLAEVGGAAYLARLAGAATVTVNAEDYARAIYELWALRTVRQTCIEVKEATDRLTPDIDARELLARLEDQIYDLRSGAEKSRFVTLAQAVQDVLERARLRQEITGVPTGLRDLDVRLGGFQPSELIILGGRPSMGKTALATTIAFNASAQGPVLFVSLEMPSEQLGQRILSERSSVPLKTIRRGLATDADLDVMARESIGISQRPLFIEDGSGLTIAQIRSRARRVQSRSGLSLIVVDYLQLVGAGDRYRGNKVAEVSEVSAALKGLAKELRVPVIALSQLSRAVEQRDDKRPTLADLRESGAIEQDADVVLFVYRDEYYVQRSEPSQADQKKYQEWLDRFTAVRGKAEIICAKARNGETWHHDFHFRGDLCRFSDLVR